jgi:hypothetical protein
VESTEPDDVAGSGAPGVAEPADEAHGAPEQTPKPEPAGPDPAERATEAQRSADRPDIDVGGNRKGPSRNPGSDKSSAEQPDTEHQVTQITYHFYSGVDAPEGVFGVQDGSERRAGGQRRVTGKLAADEIEAMVTRYAEPACFADAVAGLRKQNVIVVEGRPGSGRRAGAINVLRQVTSQALVVLSPSLSVRELAERKYDEGCGYLVVDRIRDRDRADLEFSWSNVREQVREAKAYLVITSSVVGTAATSAVPHVTWDRPPAEKVLRAQLAGTEEPDAIVRELLVALTEDCSLANLAAVARMIREDGFAPAEALKRLHADAGREVRQWFAENPDHREVVAAAALCFLEGTDVRTFETMLDRLHEVMAEHVSGKRAKATVLKKDADVFVERESRLHGTGLLDVRDVPWGAGTIQHVVFKDEAYRRHVLDELWRTRSIQFWDAIREWLAVAVAVDGDDIAVASGLAWLACSSVVEVERSFLEPWAEGIIGRPGQVTATYVLWYMCHREGLAPVALRTAVRWACATDVDRQWTAALAFGGELGMYFPSDAVNRLWQLLSRKTELWPVGCTALACLFATLSDDEHGDPSTVLNLLELKMSTFGTGAGRPDAKKPMPAAQLTRMRNLTMSACLSVFAINSIRTGRPAIFEHMFAHQERIQTIARIWAGLIIFRPLRWEAFRALRRGLHALRDISADPPATARMFGAALADALPPDERQLFKDEFLKVDERMRRGQKKPPAEVLLACLDAITVEIHPGGTR